MIRIPTAEKAYGQENTSDLTGNIYVTKNISFDSQGYLQLSNATPAMYSQADDADFDEVAAFCRCDDYGYFAGTHDAPYEIDEIRPYGVKPAKIVDAGAIGCDIEGDATFFGSSMIVSQDTDVDYYTPSTNTWTDTNISLTGTSQSQHPLEHFLSLNALAVANVTSVALYVSPITATPTPFASGGVNSVLQLPPNFYVTGMTYFNDNLYVATMNREGGKAALYVWDGTGTAAQSVYAVDSLIIWDVETYQDSVVCITGSGEILRFNGSGFTQLAALPIYYTERKMADESNIDMYKNCLKAAGDLLYINWCSDAYDLKLNDQSDGIWCYDPKVGMYHRYAPSGATAIYDTIPTTDVNTTTNVITVTAAPITGTECLYNAANSTAIAGLTHGRKYYVIKLTSTTIQLASTLANAQASTAIDLTGTGNNSQVLTFFPKSDYGQKYTPSRASAILPIERVIEEPQFGIDLFWSAPVCERTISDGNGIMGCASSAIANRGYFIIPKIFSSETTDNYNKVVLKFSPFTDESDQIIIKYRTFDDMNIEQVLDTSTWVATWTSTTTFTTTETSMANYATDCGYEVEFTRGGGAGYIMHIASITEAGGTYTVTLDEPYAYYESGDTCNFIVRNWLKWKTISYGDSNANQYFLNEQLGVKGKMLQLKIELRGVKVRIEELLVNNVVQLPAK
jgi:hypothetical protein